MEIKQWMILCYMIICAGDVIQPTEVVLVKSLSYTDNLISCLHGDITMDGTLSHDHMCR